MNYNKTIDPADYEQSDLFQHIDNMRGVMDGLYTPWGTEYRKWEYGLVLTALRKNGAKTVLEIGGGSSLFAASAIWAGFEVAVIDPEDYRGMFRKQSQRIGKEIPFLHDDFFNYPEGEQYDAVVCISTIEHVPEYAAFFEKLLRFVKPSGLLCLTTDFHPSGAAVFPGHIRTYSAENMLALIESSEPEFKVYGSKPNYGKFEPVVHGMYSFASLVLKEG